MFFRCPHVSSFDMLQTHGTGYDCQETSFPSIQYDWCCNTKSTTNIPHCDDVEFSHDPVHDRPETPDNADVCPNDGCPIESVLQVGHNDTVNYQCILNTA